MRQFNLEDWLKDKSQKIRTRDGRSVRIVCWDLPGDHPIIGITDETNDGYTTLNLPINGKSQEGKDNLDLFFDDSV